MLFLDGVYTTTPCGKSRLHRTNAPNRQELTELVHTISHRAAGFFEHEDWTGLSRLLCPNEVAETVLGYSRKGIEGTYDLHRYEAKCRQWLQKWADHMDSLIGTG